VSPGGRRAEFVRVCGVGKVSEGVPRAFSVAGVADPERVLVNVGGELFALSGICPHESADLSEGVVSDGALWCPRHSSGFDCRTGAVIHPPASAPLKTYRVRTDRDGVHVRLLPGP
jgi:3-phenylpropionate/trans-cinnamate dioxygenase ferredoxin subunit